MTLSALGIFSAAGAGGVAGGDFELIETQILGTAQSAITFSGLATYASTYKHLQLRITNRQTGAGNLVSIAMRFNADTGSNYSFHRLFGSGSTLTSDSYSTQTSGYISGSPAGTEAANVFGGYVVDILDAFSTTKFKTSRSLSGTYATNCQIHVNSNLWQSTSAITSITLTAQNTNHAVGSRFSIYGIK